MVTVSGLGIGLTKKLWAGLCIIVILCIFSPLLYQQYDWTSDYSRPQGEKRYKEVEAAYHLNNIPDEYIAKGKMKEFQATGCAEYPPYFNLKFNNYHWQVLETKQTIFYFYGAYYDNRLEDQPVIRVLASTETKDLGQLFCQVWFREELLITAVEDVVSLQIYGDELLKTYVLACKIPVTHKKKIPDSVSIVDKKCGEATNNLRVVYNTVPLGEEKRSFAVCSKGLSILEDESIDIAEWFEVLFAFGADKIDLYSLDIHPNIQEVLRYFVEEGQLEVTPLTLPGFQPNSPILQHKYLYEKVSNRESIEQLIYNDCFYRNMYRYDYIAVLDQDEVIVPVYHNTWADMLHEVQAIDKYGRAAWMFNNYVFFWQEQSQNSLHLPKELVMLTSYFRLPMKQGNAGMPQGIVKYFANTTEVKIVEHHQPRACLRGPCSLHFTLDSIGKTHHYRKQCPDDKICDNKGEFKHLLVEDNAINKVESEVLHKMQHLRNEIGFEFKDYNEADDDDIYPDEIYD